MRKHLLPIGAAAAVATGIAFLGTPSSAAPTAHSAASAAGGHVDIDGDGHADLAEGAPDATVGDFSKAGYVALTFGTKTGISVSRHQQLTQSSAGVPGTPEKGDRFGSALATGDMDGDGHADLIVGASGEAIGDVKNAGSVTVVFGSSTGLSGKAIAFHSPSVASGRNFGGRLAVGDFNHDGLQDVATPDGTKVDVVYGAKNLPSTPTPKITRITPPGGGAGTGRISSGDVNGDGFADLVTVAYFDDPADEGTLGVLPGSTSGLSSKPLGKDIGLPFAGYNAAVGDINGDGKDDVLVDTGFSDGPDDFKLRTFPGTATGLDADNAVVWKGAVPSGTAADLADIDGDGYDDVVIPDPNAEDSDGFQGAGALTVLRGGTSWLTETGKQTVSLDTKGVAGVAESGDAFGTALAPADYNGDGTADLAVGARGKWLGTGAVSMIYGSADGLTGDGSILFGPDSLNYSTVRTSFGAALSVPPAS